jgi:flavin reductase (DIM6/NTAB) family NADH-FMN oxidoreductase RutF
MSSALGSPSRQEALRGAFGSFATGVVVVSTQADGGWLGNTVSSFNTVSLQPPLVLFSMQRNRRSFSAWQMAETFAVSVLSSKQVELSRRFSGTSVDKWTGVATRAGRCVDAPALEGALAVFECRTWARYDGGDHLIIVGEVLDFDAPKRTCRPLLFYGSGYHEIQPSTAPTGAHPLG